MLSSFNSSSGTKDAIARAAANFISSVICVARPSRAPFENTGESYYIVDLIWGNRNVRFNHFCTGLFARSGMISGTGFAMANKIPSRFIEATISSVTIPGAETPTKKSQRRQRHRQDFPSLPDKLVTSIISFCIQFKSLLFLLKIPDLSQSVTSLNP